MVRQIIVYIAIIALLLFVLGITGTALYFTLTGTGAVRPTLSVITYTPSAQKTKSTGEQPIMIVTSTLPVKALTKTQSQATPLTLTTPVVPLSTPQCGLKSPVNLLYINLGKEGERLTSQAVRMVDINPIDKTINVVSFPCDLWVTTPSLVKDYTISAIRLCSIIQIAKNSPGKNPTNMDIGMAIQMGLNDTFQVKSDQYLITTTDSLTKSVDMLKNIEFLSPVTTTLAGINLQKGKNQIDSSAIFSLFSANSLDNSTWDTINRQNNVLMAIYNKFFAQSPMALSDLIKGSNSSSSFSNQDMASLQCTLKDIPSDQIKFSEIIKENTITGQDGATTISDLPKILAEMKILFESSQIDISSPTPQANNSDAVTPTKPPQPVVDSTSTPQLQQAQPPVPNQVTDPTQAPPQKIVSQDGKTLVDQRCIQCHDLGTVQKKHTVSEWQGIIADMINRGAKLNTQEQDAVLQYLSTSYSR